MHRTKVRVAEDVLDANATIARANREDFDRAGVRVVNLMSAPGAGKTTLLERVLGDGLLAAGHGVRAGVLEGDVQGSLDAERLSLLHVPVTQLNTDPGFGGECHLDANMVRSALPAMRARRDRPAGDRERRQPRLPGRVPRRRGRPRDGLLGDRGRGQAPEVPADVPRLRAGRGQQDRPPPPPRLLAARTSSATSTASTREWRTCSLSARTGEGVDELAGWLAGVARAGRAARVRVWTGRR